MIMNQAAVILFIFGCVALFNYNNSAEQRTESTSVRRNGSLIYILQLGQ
jgi:hypothetical protein